MMGFTRNNLGALLDPVIVIGATGQVAQLLTLHIMSVSTSALDVKIVAISLQDMRGQWRVPSFIAIHSHRLGLWRC